MSLLGNTQTLISKKSLLGKLLLFGQSIQSSSTPVCVQVLKIAHKVREYFRKTIANFRATLSQLESCRLTHAADLEGV